MSTMVFRIRPQGDLPIYRQLVNQVREAIAAGRLLPGDRLPSLREAAQASVINHLTVKQAYGILEREGLVETRRGSGTFVVSTGNRRLKVQVARDLEASLRDVASRARLAGMDGGEFIRLAEEAWREREGGS